MAPAPSLETASRSRPRCHDNSPSKLLVSAVTAWPSSTETPVTTKRNSYSTLITAPTSGSGSGDPVWTADTSRLTLRRGSCQTPTERLGSSGGSGHRRASFKIRRAARPASRGVPPTAMRVHGGRHGQHAVPQWPALRTVQPPFAKSLRTSRISFFGCSEGLRSDPAMAIQFRFPQTGRTAQLPGRKRLNRRVVPRRALDASLPYLKVTIPRFPAAGHRRRTAAETGSEALRGRAGGQGGAPGRQRTAGHESLRPRSASLLCPGPGKARHGGDLRVGEPTLVHAADNRHAGVGQTVSDRLLQDLLGGQG